MLFKTSTLFLENLEQFPSIEHVERIEFHQNGRLLSEVKNADGQKGSLALYFYLFKTMGVLDVSTAKRGLELYAEHTQDAKTTPGKHPNIDRLILIEATNQPMEMKVFYQEGAEPANTWDDDKEEDQ